MNISLRNTALPVLALAAAGLMAACTTAGEPSTATSSDSATPSTSATDSLSTPEPAPAEGLPTGVNAEMAQSLCDDLGAQAQSMRTYTPTVGKVTLNGTVGTWSMRYNVNLVDLAQHREKVDQILEVQCPDLRADVIRSLQIPDIASGLLGT